MTLLEKLAAAASKRRGVDQLPALKALQTEAERMADDALLSSPLSNNELARKLGISPQAVSQRKATAKKRSANR